MNNHTAQCFDPCGYPDCVLYRKYEFAGFYRSFVSYPIVGWFGFRMRILIKCLKFTGLVLNLDIFP